MMGEGMMGVRTPGRNARRMLMAGAALALLGGAAEARPKAPPKPDPRDAEIQALKEQVQALAAKVDGLEARAAAAAAAPPPAPPPPRPPAAVAVVQTPPGPPAPS